MHVCFFNVYSFAPYSRTLIQNLEEEEEEKKKTWKLRRKRPSSYAVGESTTFSHIVRPTYFVSELIVLVRISCVSIYLTVYAFTVESTAPSPV